MSIQYHSLDTINISSCTQVTFPPRRIFLYSLYSPEHVFELLTTRNAVWAGSQPWLGERVTSDGIETFNYVKYLLLYAIYQYSIMSIKFHVHFLEKNAMDN